MTKQDSTEATQPNATKRPGKAGELGADLAKNETGGATLSLGLCSGPWLYDFMDKILGKYYVCTVVFLLLFAWLIFSISNGTINDAAFWTMLLVGVAALQLGRKHRNDRVAFLENYASKFFTDEKLFKTFHELVYTYYDDKFEKVNQIKEEKNLIRERYEAPIFEPFNHLQDGRKEGSRFYHPALFQGSLEEQRLDVLLCYFSIIAYNYARGLTQLQDITGSLGYYLSIMYKRKVIKSYIEACIAHWAADLESEDQYYNKISRTHPYIHVEELLKDVNYYLKTEGI